MKKILFFHEEFPSGGAEKVTIDIAKQLDFHGYKVYVLTHKVKQTSKDYLTVIEVPEQCDVRSLTNAKYIADTINSLSIDFFVLPVWPICDELEYVKAHTNCRLVFALHSAPLWEVICDLHNKRIRSEKSFLRRLQWRLLVYPKTMWLKKYDHRVVEVHKRIYNLVDRYVVLCEGYKSFLMTKLKSDDSKLCVIQNSQKEPSFVNLDKKKQILFVGRMNYIDKRIDRLIAVWSIIYKKASDWELILVGDGPERKTLELEVQTKKLQRIRFVGHSDNVNDYYQDASILCLTSTFEGWPLCLTEAQSYGVVPIAFDCTAGVHEILSPSGVNGFLVTPFKKKEYARTLLKLMLSPDLLNTMRRNVIIKSMKYSSEEAKDKWLELFNSLSKS